MTLPGVMPPNVQYARHLVHVWPGGQPPPSFDNDVPHLVLSRINGTYGIMIRDSLHVITDGPDFDNAAEFVEWAKQKVTDGTLLGHMDAVQSARPLWTPGDPR